MTIMLLILIVLFILAFWDLIVGVSNDAVNFTNSAIGSKIASRKVVLIIAGLGILAGTLFSSGMMEVARKGIFNPGMFIFPEVLAIFVAVMFADVILLDLYNTYGLPTSTTVSLVFELLGAAVGLATIKVLSTGQTLEQLSAYINSEKVIAIILGIFLSVIVAFASGLLIQFITRLFFTFRYKKYIRKFGGAAAALAMIILLYFILIKGIAGSTIFNEQIMHFVKANQTEILSVAFVFLFIVFQILIIYTKINLAKIIILSGTFALALAFAANDLVNFIGVAMAGLAAFKIAGEAINPMLATMEGLAAPVKSEFYILLSAGIVMAVTIWISKKAQRVTRTEVNLSNQRRIKEQFGGTKVARSLVLITAELVAVWQHLVPEKIRLFIHRRIDPAEFKPEKSRTGKSAAFDPVRASVNLIVSAALIALGTSYKLPLSTTYVTFMVAMGTSLADGAWGSETAVNRVNGVLTVIGGWLLTALIAFTLAFIFALFIQFSGLYGIIILAVLTLFAFLRTHKIFIRSESENN